MGNAREIPRLRHPAAIRRLTGSLAGLAAGLALILAGAAPAAAAESAAVVVEVPDYQVRSESGVDIVSFSGSEPFLAEEGRPQVPFLVRTFDYPAGRCVQDVLLVERSGGVLISGLNLPVVRHQDAPEVPVTMKPGWHPAETHQWQVIQNADASTTLVLRIFPFYARPETQEAVFYQKYVFQISSVDSAVEFTRLSVDRDVYAVGDPIKIDLLLNNPAEAMDVVVRMIIRETASGAVVAELPPALLEDLSGKASYQAAWDSSAAQAADYSLEVTIAGMTGSVLGYRQTDLIVRKASELAQAETAPGWTTRTTQPRETNPPQNGEKTDRNQLLLYLAAAVTILTVIAAALGLFFARRNRKNKKN
jgi:hypothetical protein